PGPPGGDSDPELAGPPPARGAGARRAAVEELHVLHARRERVGVRAAWQRFWFEPEETSTLALVRIAFGLVVLGWTGALAHDSVAFFTGSGLLPSSDWDGRARATWGLLDLTDSRVAV